MGSWIASWPERCRGAGLAAASRIGGLGGASIAAVNRFRRGPFGGGEASEASAGDVEQATPPVRAGAESPSGGARDREDSASAGADRFWRLMAEFVGLYGALPLAYWGLVSVWPWAWRLLLPGLVVGAGVCGLALWRDAGFERERLVGWRAVRGQARPVLRLFAIGAVALLAGVVVWERDRLFGLVRTDPGLWALVMVGYPIVSVIPQGVIYRAFVFRRYRELFPGRWTMIAASAAAFGFGHIIFGNTPAVALTLVGGALFAWRYDRTRSVLASGLEHALYGCLIFTIGLGAYFLGGVS